MLRRAVLALGLVLVALTPLRAAAQGDPIADLARVLDLPRLFSVLRAEGVDHGDDLDETLLGGSGGARWQALVAAIHDPDRMQTVALARLRSELDGQDAALARIVAFFGSEQGARIVSLELAAREAYRDPVVEDAARLAWEEMRAEAGPRVAQIDRLVEANDLIEQNIAGAMNGNLAFYRGMLDGGAPGETVPDGDMMADLWSQEPMIRAETEGWLMPYLAMAYQPLSDADLEAYIAFSLTSEGQVLNRALFAAFDALFNALSRDLGLAAARLMAGQDL
jgi:hypothetical protein